VERDREEAGQPPTGDTNRAADADADGIGDGVGSGLVGVADGVDADAGIGDGVEAGQTAVGDGDEGGQAAVGDVERDRDDAGRARNARPRDGLGRPLPRGASGVPTMPDDLTVTPATALTLAQDLLDAGRPFHAHEVLEAAWKSAPPEERELWRGLAQLAVGLTHLYRGNPTGAARLLTRAADRIEQYGAVPYGIDGPGLVAWARNVTARAGADPSAPRLRLA
jgi:hypothetical protein